MNRTIRAVLGLALGLGVAGCVRVEALELPAAPADARARILVVSRPRATSSAIVWTEAATITDATAAPDVFTLAPGDRIDVLFYTGPLGALGLAPGPLPIVVGGAGRALPAFTTGHTRAVGEGASWRSLEGLEGALAELRIHESTIPECVDAGGCLVDGRCTVPCPAPTIPAAPAPPDAPALPTTTTCPAGFVRRATALDALVCAAVEPPACSADVGADAAFLGDAACAPLGAACPGAPLEAPVTPRRVSFVDATATGGDGTRARPFSTIGAALDAARSTGAPALILVEPGRYDEHVVIDGDVVLRGACAAATTIGPGPGSAAITVTAGPASIEALSVDGAIELSAGATAALWAILIRGTGSTALSIAPSASAGASELVVRGSWALGVHVEGALSLDRAIVDGPETGLSIAGATSELRATHLLVRGPAAPSSERIAGIEVDDGAHLALSESFVVRAVRAGVLASTGATVELTDVTIAQTRSAVDWSAAVLTGAASNVTITRALLEDNAATGLSVGAAARATILDSAILGSRALATFPTSGAAITTAESSTTTIERVVLEHNDAHGILAYRATVRARDVSVLGPAALVGESAGAIAVEGVQLDVERLYARDLRERGIFAIRATGTLVDLDVESVTFQRRSSRGAMLELERGTRFTVERLRGGEAENCVVAVDLGTELVLRDLLLSNPSNGGVLVRDGAHLVLERAEIRRPMDGLSVIGGDEGVPLDSTAIVRDLTIAYAATGLEVLHGPARVDVERFAIVDGDDYGLRQEGGALVDLRDGRLHGSSVGVQIAKTGYDLARVADRVRFEDVRTPFVVLE